MRLNKPIVQLCLSILLVIALILPVACSSSSSPTPATTSSSAAATTTKATSAAPVATTSASPQVAGTIKVGSVWSTGGAMGAVGTLMAQGVQLAVKYWNTEKGGVTIGGKLYRIELVEYNANSDPQQGVSITQKLIQQDKVSIILGDCISSVAAAQQPIIETAKYPWIMAASSAALTGPGFSYTNRNNVTDSMIAPVWWQNAAALMGTKNKLSILASATDFSKSRLAQAKANCPGLGINIISEDTFQSGAIDFYPTLTKIKALNPDAVYCSGYSEIGTCIKQAKEMGFNPIWLIDDTFIGEIGKVLGTAGVGVNVFATVNPMSTSEEAKIYAKYAPGTSPQMPYVINYALTWDMTNRALMALEKAGTTGTDEASLAKIAKAIREVVWTGVMTTGSYDSNGNIAEVPRILQVTDAAGSTKVVAENGKLVK